MAVNDDIFDALVRHQIGLQRLATGNVEAITARLDKYDPQILKIIQTLDAGTSKTAMDKALREIRKVNINAYLAVERDLKRAMKELAVAEGDHAHKTTIESIPDEALEQAAPKKVTQKALKALVDDTPVNGALIEEHINGAEIGRYNRIRDLIRREITSGGTDAAVQSAIKTGVMGTAGAAFKDGLLAFSRRSIEQAVKTISNGIAQAARSEYVAGNDDIFDGVQWVSVLDNKTSAICQSLDGTVFPVDLGPRPPAHPNCRSQVVPIVKDWEKMGLSDLGPGTRKSMSGEVPETTTYTEWLRGQSAQVQDDILGPSRGKLFRDLDLDVDRFVDDTGRKFTLAELADQDIL